MSHLENKIIYYYNTYDCTIDQLAHFVNLPKYKVYHILRSNKIPMRKIGRRKASVDIENVIEMKNRGCTVEEIAYSVQVSPWTIYDRIRKYNRAVEVLRKYNRKK